MAAFSRAVEIGVDIIESDVHITADGHAVLSHDDTGRRLAGDPRAISKCTLQDVQSWDIGFSHQAANGSRPHANKGYRIPTLQHALEAFPSMQWNLDIKQKGADAWQHIVEHLRQLRAEERVLLASFSARTLKEIRKGGYRGITGMGRFDVVQLALLPTSALTQFPMLVPGGNRVQVPIRSGPFLFASESFLKKCRALQFAVDFWTINTKEEAKQLLALGVDGIMTDDPQQIKTILDDMAADRPSPPFT
jgi:glycerophosphoryl diester phosphodiesterase